MTIDPAILAAARRLLPGSPALSIVGERPFLVRASVDGRDVRLRRWPDATVPERVRFVSRLMSHLAGAEPTVCAAPYPTKDGKEPVVQVGGAMVDAQIWLPGHAAAERSQTQLADGHTLHRPAPLSDDRLDALIALVAAVHLRSARFATDRTSPTAPVGQVLRAIGQSWRLARVNLRPSAPSYPPIQRWIRLGEQVLPPAEQAIVEANLHQRAPVIAHLSLWPAHVLVDRARVTGILDFSAAVATTPLVDLSQLITRFAGWTGDHAERVIGRYAEERGLTPEERRALPAVAAMDMVIEAARLLRLGYGGAIPSASQAAVAARAGAQDLLNSIEALAASVVRAADPVPYAKRRRIARSAGRAEGRPPVAEKQGAARRRPAKPQNERSEQRTDQRAKQRREQEQRH